jgi:hypothetical protein
MRRRAKPQGAIARRGNVRFDRSGGVPRIARRDRIDDVEVHAHDRRHQIGDKARLALPDQPDLELVDAPRIADDLVAEGVDDRRVHAVVDRLRLRDQGRRDALRGRGEHRFMLAAQPGEVVVARVQGELRGRLSLDHHAKAERVANQPHVDLCNLHAALRNRADQAVGLEPRDELADRAERHSSHLDELALRDELAGADLARKKAASETLVGLVAQLHRASGPAPDGRMPPRARRGPPRRPATAGVQPRRSLRHDSGARPAP